MSVKTGTFVYNVTFGHNMLIRLCYYSIKVIHFLLLSEMESAKHRRGVSVHCIQKWIYLHILVLFIQICCNLQVWKTLPHRPCRRLHEVESLWCVGLRHFSSSSPSPLLSIFCTPLQTCCGFSLSLQRRLDHYFWHPVTKWTDKKYVLYWRTLQTLHSMS